MNDTPRTNAMLTAILETHGHVGFLNCPPTWVAFARELERELNAANDRIKRLEEAIMEVKNKHAVLVADVVLNEDRAERIKRLEEAGNAMFPWSERVGQEFWLKTKEAKL